MRVLVTGCHGFIGHHVCKALAKAGHKVIAVDRIKDAVSDKGPRIKALRGVSGVEFIEANLSEWGQCVKLFKRTKPEAVFNIAAQYSVQYTTENMHNYVQSNLCMPTYLLELAMLHKVERFVYASSVAAHPDWPGGLYGASKKWHELAAFAYSHKKNLATIGLQLGVVYGPLQRADSEVYRTVIAQMNRDRLKKSSDYTKMVPFIYVEDAADMFARCLTFSMKKQKHIVLPAVANDSKASYANVTEITARLTGREPLYPDGAVLTDRGPPLDLHRLDNWLGWRPPTTLEQGLQHTIKHLERQR